VAERALDLSLRCAVFTVFLPHASDAAEFVHSLAWLLFWIISRSLRIRTDDVLPSPPPPLSPAGCLLTRAPRSWPAALRSSIFFLFFFLAFPRGWCWSGNCPITVFLPSALSFCWILCVTWCPYFLWVCFAAEDDISPFSRFCEGVDCARFSRFFFPPNRAVLCAPFFVIVPCRASCFCRIDCFTC